MTEGELHRLTQLMDRLEALFTGVSLADANV